MLTLPEGAERNKPNYGFGINRELCRHNREVLGSYCTLGNRDSDGCQLTRLEEFFKPRSGLQ